MSFGGGSGSSSISGSTDVVLNSPANNNVLGYNSSLAKWQNQNISATYAPRVPDWITARAYVVGELVVNAGVIYRTITAHTSGASFDGTKFMSVGGVGSGEPADKQAIYVDPANGSDSNDGLTQARAYRTIQAAANAAPLGAVLTLLSGTYDLAGTPVTLDPTKPLAIEGRTMPTRSWASSGPFITSTTPVDALFDIPSQAGFVNSAGFSFKNLRLDPAGLTSTGAGIRARNLCHTLVENVIGVSVTPSTTKVLIEAAPDYAHGDDCSWWRVKNCVSVGQPLMRNPVLSDTNYWVFDGCIIHNCVAGTGVYFGGARPTFTGGCDFENLAVGVHFKNGFGGTIAVLGESVPTLVLLEDSKDVEVVASLPGGSGDSTITMTGDCAGSRVAGVTHVDGLNLSGLTTARGVVVSSSQYGFNLPVIAVGQTMLLRTDFATQQFGLPNVPESMSDSLLGPGISAEYWTGSAWATWAVNTNALHVNNGDTLIADATHKRFRLSNTNDLVYGATGLLYLLVWADVAPKITVTTYAYDTTTVRSQDVIAAADASNLAGVLVGLRRGGGKVSVEIEAALTGGQNVWVGRMAMFTAWNPSTASGGVALRGRDAPEGAVTGSPGDTYACVNGAGIGFYVKASGWGTNTGWAKLLT
jgi:hypothetical protein